MNKLLPTILFAALAAPACAVSPTSGFDLTREADARCGDIAFYGLHEERIDGLSYYVNVHTGDIISECGGSCRGRVAECRRTCPPPAWTCKRPQEMQGKAVQP